MEEKKYIDRLYQEKFKDFEAAPRKDLWKDIAHRLKEEERKKPLIPLFWTRIAGVAAVLAFFLLLGDWLTQPVQNSVVTSDDEVFRAQEDQNTGVAIASEDEEIETEISEASGEQEISPENTSRLSNLFSEISSLKPSGIRSYSGQENSSDLKMRETKDNTVKTAKRSLPEEVLENNLKEEERIGSSPKNKIEVSTHAAPIYFGNLDSGNFIDPRFDSNNSEGEITYAYGINISYKVSDKLKIRSGISKVSMIHNTNDIAIHAVLNPRSLEAIDYRDDLGVRVVNGSVTWKGAPEPLASAIRSNLNNINRGLLNQRIGFIEVPLEVEYALVDDRFSINLIGGASTLFLDENSISISSGEIATVLGQANNLNEVSFSTNVGVGFDYLLSEKFKVNLEPMFKYQINTYNSSSGTYQPFFIGVYSGFSYKF